MAGAGLRALRVERAHPQFYLKATRRWRRDDGNALRELHERRVIQTAAAVYGGKHAQQDGPVTVLPVPEFLCRLPDLIA
jgi:hypothetical protein